MADIGIVVDQQDRGAGNGSEAGIYEWTAVALDLGLSHIPWTGSQVEPYRRMQFAPYRYFRTLSNQNQSVPYTTVPYH